jgi:hypothetical protein
VDPRESDQRMETLSESTGMDSGNNRVGVAAAILPKKPVGILQTEVLESQLSRIGQTTHRPVFTRILRITPRKRGYGILCDEQYRARILTGGMKGMVGLAFLRERTLDQVDAKRAFAITCGYVVGISDVCSVQALIQRSPHALECRNPIWPKVQPVARTSSISDGANLLKGCFAYRHTTR